MNSCRISVLPITVPGKDVQYWREDDKTVVIAFGEDLDDISRKKAEGHIREQYGISRRRRRATPMLFAATASTPHAKPAAAVAAGIIALSCLTAAMLYMPDSYRSPIHPPSSPPGAPSGARPSPRETSEPRHPDLKPLPARRGPRSRVPAVPVADHRPTSRPDGIRATAHPVPRFPRKLPKVRTPRIVPPPQHLPDSPRMPEPGSDRPYGFVMEVRVEVLPKVLPKVRVAAAVDLRALRAPRLGS